MCCPTSRDPWGSVASISGEGEHPHLNTSYLVLVYTLVCSECLRSVMGTMCGCCMLRCQSKVVKTVIYKPKGVTLLDYSDKLKDYPERLSTLIAEKLATVISTHVFFHSSGPTSVSHLKSCKHYWTSYQMCISTIMYHRVFEDLWFKVHRRDSCTLTQTGGLLCCSTMRVC